MWFNYLVLFTALTISGVAAYYSIIGLTAIFAAAFWPIVIMGSVLEAGKLVTSVWLKKFWHRTNWQLKCYLTFAVSVLMLITSMGIFGFLSKAHMDQGVPSGDIAAQVSLIDEKIKTQRDNIEANRKALAQMDATVDQTISRSTTEQGASNAANLRRSQTRERTALQNEIAVAQKAIAKLNEERAPVASQLRKVEAEVGPIKYVAALIYGDNPDQNLLEKAVRWVIIILVLVFDPLAVALILAANSSMRWKEQEDEPQEAESVIDIPLEKINQELAQETTEVDAAAEALDSAQNLPEPAVIQDSALKKERDLLFQAHSTELIRADQLQTKLDDAIDQLQLAQYNLGQKETELEVVAKKLEDLVELSKNNTDANTDVSQLMLAKDSEIFLMTEEINKQKDEIKRLTEHLEKLQSLDKFYQGIKQIQGEPDGFDPNEKPESSVADFGTDFPNNPSKGLMFVRVDMLPHKVFKFNGSKWIEIDKNSTDTYIFNEEYVRHLINLLAAGQLELDQLNETELVQVKRILQREGNVQ